jgi:nitrous oxidase accessory protein NosD
MIRIALISVGTLLVAARLGSTTTFVVPPGPGTPIQDAINAAAPGDTIRLTLGAYGENLVIDKALKLRGVRSASVDPGGTTILNGTCAGGPRIVVAADSVQLRGIQVVGSVSGGVQIFGRDRIKMTDVFVSAHCDGTGAAAVDIVASTRVSLKAVWASGLNQAPIPHPGIRIADTPQAGRIRVKTSIGAGFDRGISLENDGILSVRVSASYFNFNNRGIVLQGTSRAVIDHNRQIIDNAISGIELDATSSGNSIVRNTISGSTNDVVDNGTDNCWRNNTFGTGSVAPCP